MKQRIAWIDTIRFIAIAIVAWGHFEEAYGLTFLQSLKNLNPITNFLIVDYPAKWAVAVFSVLMGFFATKSARKSKSMVYYVLNRYTQFAIGIAMAELLILAFFICERFFPIEQTVPHVNSWLQNNTSFHTMIQNMLSDIFFFSYKFFATIWCLGVFFMGSVIIYVLEKIKAPMIGVILVMLVCIIHSDHQPNVFLGITLLGMLLCNMIDAIQNKPKVKRIFVHPVGVAGCLLLGVVLCQNYQNMPVNFLFTMYGISFLFVFIAIYFCRPIQKLLSVPPLPVLGKWSFGIYLFHVFAYKIIAYLSYVPLRKIMPANICWGMLIVVFFAATVMMSWLYTKISDKIQAKIMKKFEYLKNGNT